MVTTFYQQIKDALNRDLDGQLFEHCAVDLLNSDFPGISPISGGSDSGMDGGVFDGHGPPFPLVTTTGKDCMGNLRRNLTKYVSDGGTRRKVIFATSQKLTPKRRQNLFNSARDVGFDLLQVFEQTAIADRLYRNSNWCKTLLGLTGSPEPLATVPSGARRLLGEHVYGQSAVIEALQNSAGDKVLVGPPGSGKTFLLYNLARKDLGLFVETNDTAEIANGIREHQPKLLFLDDSANKRELLRDLKRIRGELKATFKIVACGWTSHKDLLIDALDLQASDAIQIQRLTRDEIVDVISDMGIRSPTGLVNEIVWQSDGLPGLAVTICAAALHGDIEAVSTAESLTRFWVNRLSECVDSRSRQVLAVISLTGDTGATLMQVSKALDISQLEIQQIATGLALGGVLHEAYDSKLIVRPIRFRGALIRDVFFTGSLSLDIESVLPHLDNGIFAFELIHAKHLGAKVPDQLIRRELSNRRCVDYPRLDEDPLFAYAYLGAEEANYVLDLLRVSISKYSEPLLQHSPEETLRRMLNTAKEDRRPLHSNSNHPVRKIQDWVNESMPSSPQAIKKRIALIEVAVKWFDSDEEAEVFATAIGSAFSLKCAWQDAKPGSGLTFKVYRSCLRTEQINELFCQWPKVIDVLSRRNVIAWEPLLSLLQYWVYPGLLSANIDDKTCETIHAHAEQMIRSLAALCRSSPGVQQKLKAYSKVIEVEIEFDYNSHFDILFPIDLKRSDARMREACFEQAESLAADYQRLSPQELAQTLRDLELESEKARVTSSMFFLAFCGAVAACMSDLMQCVEELRNHDVSADALSPFLTRLVNEKPVGYEAISKSVLSDHRYQTPMIICILGDGTNSDLVNLAVKLASPAWRAIETSVLRGQINDIVVGRLLRSDDPKLAAAVAFGLWHRAPQNSVPDSLQKDWRQAVVGSYACERIPEIFEEVFEVHPDLAFEFLQKLTGETNATTSGLIDDYLSDVCSKLNQSQKLWLIDEMTVNAGCRQIVEHVVGEDVAVFQRLLSNSELKSLHVVPLRKLNTTSWPLLAITALDSGIEAKLVAQSALRLPLLWHGNESDIHKERIRQLTMLEHNDHNSLREVIKLLLKWENAAVIECLESERREAVFGL